MRRVVILDIPIGPCLAEHAMLQKVAFALGTTAARLEWDFSWEDAGFVDTTRPERPLVQNRWLGAEARYVFIFTRDFSEDELYSLFRRVCPEGVRFIISDSEDKRIGQVSVPKFPEMYPRTKQQAATKAGDDIRVFPEIGFVIRARFTPNAETSKFWAYRIKSVTDGKPVFISNLWSNGGYNETTTDITGALSLFHADAKGPAFEWMFGDNWENDAFATASLDELTALHQAMRRCYDWQIESLGE